ncbi:MAG TPA: DUF1206 domain-containing protein [Opitutaceae bacterium]|nr:DUF1206 domain-containing protein [Opitutaceae bacterium]
MNRSTQKTLQELRPWIVGIARVGFAAKGTIYFGVGLLALSLALGFTQQAHDTHGAVEQLSQVAFGRFVLLALALGLVCFGLWNLVQCIWDPEGVGTDWVGKALRVLFGLSTALNGFLAYKFGAIGLGRSWGSETGDAAVKSWTERILQWPGGRIIILTSAVIVAIVAVSQVVRLVRGKFMDVFSDSELKQTQNKWVKISARLGFAAQAIVVGLVAWFLWRAGLTRESDEAGSFTKALQTLLQQPHGRWILGFTAIGVIARGVFIWLMVPYREIRLKRNPEGLAARWRRIFGS